MGRLYTDTSAMNIACGDVTEIDSVAGMTMTFWEKRTATNKHMDIGKITDLNNRIWVSINTDNVMYVSMANGGAAYGRINSWGAGSWNHVAYVFDGSQSTNADKLKIYKNGTYAAFDLGFTGTIGTSTPNMSAFNIGYLSPVNFRSNGSFAEVRLYDVVLTETQILMDKAGLFPVQPVGYWRLGVGSPEPDWSGNGYSGTLSNSPTVTDHPPVSVPWQTKPYYRIIADTAPSGNPWYYYHQQNLLAGM